MMKPQAALTSRIILHFADGNKTNMKTQPKLGLHPHFEASPHSNMRIQGGWKTKKNKPFGIITQAFLTFGKKNSAPKKQG